MREKEEYYNIILIYFVSATFNTGRTSHIDYENSRTRL